MSQVERLEPRARPLKQLPRNSRSEDVGRYSSRIERPAEGTVHRNPLIEYYIGPVETDGPSSQRDKRFLSDFETGGGVVRVYRPPELV